MTPNDPDDPLNVTKYAAYIPVALCPVCDHLIVNCTCPSLPRRIPLRVRLSCLISVARVRLARLIDPYDYEDEDYL